MINRIGRFIVAKTSAAVTDSMNFILTNAKL